MMIKPLLDIVQKKINIGKNSNGIIEIGPLPDNTSLYLKVRGYNKDTASEYSEVYTVSKDSNKKNDIYRLRKLPSGN